MALAISAIFLCRSLEWSWDRHASIENQLTGTRSTLFVDA